MKNCLANVQLSQAMRQTLSACCGELEAAFDDLFATQTGYEALDERIATLAPRCGCSAGETRVKKTSLLPVLKHPEIPLHNNTSELGGQTESA
jgi:hypothetical protein